jgi:hypothetical protein
MKWLWGYPQPFFYFYIKLINMLKFGLGLFLSVFLISSGFAQTTAVNQLDGNGKRTGVWISYYPNGKIKYKRKFLAGFPIDTLTRYYQDGQTKAILVNQPGTKIYSAKLYDEDGLLRATGN